MDLTEWWKHTYDQWLVEGDLTMLNHLQKIERYLQKGRIKSSQETINLMAQIEGLLDLTYQGTYRYINVHILDPDLVVASMDPYPPIKCLPEHTDIDAIYRFLENKSHIQIKPQNIGDVNMDIHPCWILWSQLYNDKYRHELWAYRKQFVYYMLNKDYLGASQTYQHAYHIKVRCEALPILHPYVIEKVMYSNIDYKLRQGIDAGS